MNRIYCTNSYEDTGVHLPNVSGSGVELFHAAEAQLLLIKSNVEHGNGQV